MTCRRTKFKNYVDEEAKRKNTTKSRVLVAVVNIKQISVPAVPEIELEGMGIGL